MIENVSRPSKIQQNWKIQIVKCSVILYRNATDLSAITDQIIVLGFASGNYLCYLTPTSGISVYNILAYDIIIVIGVNAT